MRAVQQIEARRRGKRRAAEGRAEHRGVGRGRLREDDVARAEVRADRAAGPDPDQGTHAVRGEELVYVDRRRGHPHPGALHRYPVAAIGAGEPEGVAHAVVTDRAVEESVRDELRAQRIAG